MYIWGTVNIGCFWIHWINKHNFEKLHKKENAELEEKITPVSL